MPKTPKSIDALVGRLLAQLRHERGMSQTELGDALGVTYQQIQKYEGGNNRVSASRLAEIAAVFSVPVGFFFATLPGQATHSAIDPASEAVLDFCSTSEGLSLNRALQKISDAATRRALLRVCEAIASQPSCGG